MRYDRSLGKETGPEIGFGVMAIEVILEELKSPEIGRMLEGLGR